MDVPFDSSDRFEQPATAAGIMVRTVHWLQSQNAGKPRQVLLLGNSRVVKVHGNGKPHLRPPWTCPASWCVDEPTQKLFCAGQINEKGGRLVLIVLQLPETAGMILDGRDLRGLVVEVEKLGRGEHAPIRVTVLGEHGEPGRPSVDDDLPPDFPVWVVLCRMWRLKPVQPARAADPNIVPFRRQA